MKRAFKSLIIAITIVLLGITNVSAQETGNDTVTQYCQPYVTCGWSPATEDITQITLVGDTEGANPYFRLESAQPINVAVGNTAYRQTTLINDRQLPINTPITVNSADKYNMRVMVSKPTTLTFQVSKTVDPALATTQTPEATVAGVSTLPATGSDNNLNIFQFMWYWALGMWYNR